ncbi:MAG TPA: hypothetical protein VG055_03205 [Planctomycetaceae bacterium]|jgi:hypothetical protein|nr:hypothetical protein [Planctomycetaceae bacterium]
MAKGYFLFGDVRATMPFDPDDVLWFGKQLQANGIDVRSAISPAIAAARNLAMLASVLKHAAEQLPDTVQVQMGCTASFDFAAAASMISVIRGLRRAHSANPELLCDAWRILGASAPTSTPQQQSNERDHLWEILNTAVYSHFGQAVHLNLVDAGADVSGNVGGVDWGIECKVLYSHTISRRVDRIVDGVKQVEDDATVAKGVVAVSVTDCIDHTPFANSFRNGGAAFASSAAVAALLATRVKQCAIETTTKSLQRRLARDKDGQPRRKCRAVIYVGQTIALARGSINVFTAQLTSLRSPPEAADRAFATQYHEGWDWLQNSRPG